MEDATTPVISGIVVLLAGVLAFIVVVGGESKTTESAPVETSVVSGSLSDLEPAVERVLLSTGEAWTYQTDSGAGLPDELARVLDAYQVPLMVPVGESQ